MSTRLEGLGGLDDDVERLSRLLGSSLRGVLIVAKKLGRQCYVSGDFEGIARERRGEVVGVLCNVVEKKLEDE